MSNFELGEMQSRFADLIWEKEPVPSGDLVKMAEERFGWKDTTTYTVLHVLCKKGLFVNERSVVRSLVSRDEFYLMRSKQVINQGFGGSLPSFVSAFSSSRKMTEKEMRKLKEMIEQYLKENDRK